MFRRIFNFLEKDVDTLGALYLIVSLFIVIVILIICTIGAVTATRIVKFSTNVFSRT